MEGVTVMMLAGLGAWTAISLAWWLIVLRVTSTGAPADDSPAVPTDAPMLSVFKPVPELGTGSLTAEEELEHLAEAIGSFVDQLDTRSELLLGIPESDRPAWSPFIDRWSQATREGQVRVVYREPPDHHANPKIAWQEALSALASGNLWLWSDADVVAPRGFLARARAEWSDQQPGLLTHTYVIRRIRRAPGLLEALFVNAEFFPGALLLGRLRALRFGFGACMLFEAEAFRRRVDWPTLGAHLAEDHALGHRLSPVRLGTDVLETSGQATRWRDALSHYARWQKTIRWCQPGGFAGQLVILPLVGWMIFTAAAPFTVAPWLGLGLLWQLEATVALAIFRRVGCPVGWRRRAVFWAWPILRPCVWLACWLPWPVRWRDRFWWSPQAQAIAERDPELAATEP